MTGQSAYKFAELHDIVCEQKKCQVLLRANLGMAPEYMDIYRHPLAVAQILEFKELTRIFW